MALSQDLRHRVVDCYHCGKESYQKVAHRFNIGICSVRRWVALEKETGFLKPRPINVAKPKIPPAQYYLLRQLVAEKPDRTLDELAFEWEKRFKVKMGNSSMSRSLIKAGLTLKKRPFAVACRIPKQITKS